MSTVKVNTISTWTGSDISIETGKTVSGTASQFKMTDVVQGDVLYGSAADTLSRLAPGTAGQHLQTAGAGANPVWAAPPTGGLTHSSIWRLTTTFSNSAAVINANLEAVDAPVGFGSIGAAMTESAGVFTFPVTGIWLIQGHFYYWQNGNGSAAFGTGYLQTTTDNSTYAYAASCRTSDYYSAYGSMTVQYIFDVTDTANCKCYFEVLQGLAAAQIKGDTDVNKTYFTFTKLGDT